jgi:hypothetical protein
LRDHVIIFTPVRAYPAGIPGRNTVFSPCGRILPVRRHGTDRAETAAARLGRRPHFLPRATHAMRRFMGDEVIDLVGRIDRALARIEAAATSPASAPAMPPAMDDGRAAALEAAHGALRARVESAISQIDRVIGSGETG